MPSNVAICCIEWLRAFGGGLHIKFEERVAEEVFCSIQLNAQFEVHDCNMECISLNYELIIADITNLGRETRQHE